MPLTIFFSTPGTYTIDDDGIRGNGVSVVRDSNGNVLFPITHPADAISFIAQVPGVHLIFNVADSFGTANVTVGNLASAADSPDSIVVRNLRSDAFITLASNGSITEGGADPSADISAAGLIMSAATGIGTPANAIETQVVFLEAETNTGGINLANAGSVQLGGLTSDVNGLSVATSGDINFSTTGFILVADTSGTSSIHGADISGNVTLTALGADADIFTNINQKMISVAGGGVTLNAGRDILIGTNGANFDNDVLATGPITVRAGHDFVLDGNSNIRTGAFGGVIGGAIDIQAGRNISLTNGTGGLQTIQAFAGDVILTTGPGGAFLEDASIPGAIQTSEDIVLTADNVTINSGGLNNTGIGSVTIRPVTPGRAIDLGTALDGPAALGLSDDEFDLLFTLNAIIGDANSGPVQFSAALTPFILDNLTVRSSADILVNSSLSLPRTLTLIAGDDLIFTPAGSFASANGGFIGLADNAQDDDGLGATGLLGGPISVGTTIMLQGNQDPDLLVGTGGGDILLGNGGNDTLQGNGGGDMLDGGAGADNLNGGADNDMLVGGSGVDVMDGGLGNDRYYADNALDQLVEASGGGSDILLASVNYVLADGVFVESLATTDNAGTAAINLTGNSLDNSMSGNAGANILNGGGGADTMQGLGGNDRYYVDNLLDRVIEGSGGGTDLLLSAVSYTVTDTVFVESLATTNNAGTTAINLTGNGLDNGITGNAGTNVLTGNGGNDSLVGLGGADTLRGNAGNDSLFGGLGADSLTGGTGADMFRFDSALGGGNVDTITDFAVVDDMVLLENAVFTGLAAGALPASAFVTGSAAADANDRIIYNSATGALLFDVDGVGGVAAVQFATLQTGLALTASDFVVV